MNIVEDFLHQPIPAELWHYTTIDAFEGMVSSGTIWASEVHSSRDRTEFVHARQIADDYLGQLDPGDMDTSLGIEAAKHIVSEVFETGWLSQDKTEVFIASFSAAPDRKSQWIDYSAGGRGVAVVMDLRNVRPPFDLRSAVTLAPCVYKTVDKVRLIEHATHYMIEAVRDAYSKSGSSEWATQALKIWRLVDEIYHQEFDRKAFDFKIANDFSSQLHDARALMSIDLLRLASHCKHQGYFEEEEWRLALPHTKEHPLRFSKVEHRGQTDIPYVAHRISGQSKLPIVRAVTGFACKDIERVKKALEQHGYNIPVGTSELPETR